MGTKRVELYYIFAAYVAFIMGIAVYIFAQNKKKTAAFGDGEVVSDHFLAGRNTPAVLLVLTTFSTVFSGYTMIGVPDEAYEYGFFALRWAGTTISIAISFLCSSFTLLSNICLIARIPLVSVLDSSSFFARM